MKDKLLRERGCQTSNWGEIAASGAALQVRHSSKLSYGCVRRASVGRCGAMLHVEEGHPERWGRTSREPSGASTCGLRSLYRPEPRLLQECGHPIQNKPVLLEVHAVIGVLDHEQFGVGHFVCDELRVFCDISFTNGTTVRQITHPGDISSPCRRPRLGSAQR